MKLVRELEAIGATPTTIAKACDAYKRHPLLGGKGTPITVAALAKWYDALLDPPRAAHDRRQVALAFVENVGHEFPEAALREELGRYKLPADEVETLLELAAAKRRVA
jgi:hypothetical protein